MTNLFAMDNGQLNLGSAEDPVAFQLGNFAPACFVVDEVVCRSAEGFIQSLKFEDPDQQRAVCQLIGGDAKFAGKKQGKKVAKSGIVHWNGEAAPFRSERHQQWIATGIRAKFQQDFDSQFDLVSTGSRELVHDTGRPESRFTSLPASEFIEIVTSVRDELIADCINVTFDGEHTILSNLAATRFELEGASFGSVEAFVQSIKHPPGPRRDRIAMLSGYHVQRAGKNPNKAIRKRIAEGQSPEPLQWKNRMIPYQSTELVNLIRQAIRAKFAANQEAMSVLVATGTRPLTYQLYRNQRRSTSFTAKDFCRVLFEIRREAIVNNPSQIFF